MKKRTCKSDRAFARWPPISFDDSVIPTLIYPKNQGSSSNIFRYESMDQALLLFAQKGHSWSCHWPDRPVLALMSGGWVFDANNSRGTLRSMFGRLVANIVVSWRGFLIRIHCASNTMMIHALIMSPNSQDSILEFRLF